MRPVHSGSEGRVHAAGYGGGMSKTEHVVIRILLLVAKLMAPSDWRKDVEQLASHISVHVKEQAQ